MNNPNAPLETRLEEVGHSLPYPATPDVAGRVAQRISARSAKPLRLRRMAVALTALMLLCAALWTVPPVRASILEFLQIGSVRIWLVEPTATPIPTPVPTDIPSGIPTRAADRPTSTPAPTATPLTSLLSLAGETTLDDAQARTAFPIRLPTYPPDLGAPDRVFKQDMPATTVVLAWLDENDTVKLSLHILTEGAIAYKMQPISVEQTVVHGESALWTTGPYWLQMDQFSLASFRLIEGHTLVWAEGSLTYRLETDLPLEEAVRVAESLQ